MRMEERIGVRDCGLNVEIFMSLKGGKEWVEVLILRAVQNNEKSRSDFKLYHVIDLALEFLRISLFLSFSVLCASKLE